MAKIHLSPEALEEARKRLRKEFNIERSPYFYAIKLEKALIEARIQIAYKDLPF